MLIDALPLKTQLLGSPLLSQLIRAPLKEEDTECLQGKFSKRAAERLFEFLKEPKWGIRSQASVCVCVLAIQYKRVHYISLWLV